MPYIIPLLSLFSLPLSLLSSPLSPLPLSLAVEQGKALTLPPLLESVRTASPPSPLHQRRNRPSQRKKSRYPTPSKLLHLVDSAVTPAGHLHQIPFPLGVVGGGPSFRLRGPVFPPGGRTRVENQWGVEGEGWNTRLATVRLAWGPQERTRICLKWTSKCCKVLLLGFTLCGVYTFIHSLQVNSNIICLQQRKNTENPYTWRHCTLHVSCP